jgi:hypothetical protein
MVRIPLPQRVPSPGGMPQFSAPNVVPQADASGGQLQQVGQGLQRFGQGLSAVPC